MVVDGSSYCNISCEDFSYQFVLMAVLVLNMKWPLFFAILERTNGFCHKLSSLRHIIFLSVELFTFFVLKLKFISIISK